MKMSPPRKTLALLALLGAATAHADAPARLKEVTVTTTALAGQREAVTQKTIIDRKEIEALGGLTIGEIARKLPGIEIGEHGADGGLAARARGLGKDSVQFLVNGERPTANPRFALTQIGRMSTAELERIEILRGGSAEHGGTAAVTVNFIVRRPPAQSQITVRAAIGQRGGEPNAQIHLSRGDAAGGFSWQLPVSLNRHAMPTDLWRERDATTLGAGQWQRDHERGDYAMNELIVAPRFSWKGAAGNFGLWPSYYHNDGVRNNAMTRQSAPLPAGAPLAAGGGRRDAEDSAIRILRLRAEGDTRLGENKLSARASAMHGWRTAARQRRAHDAAGHPAAAWREDERREDDEFSAALRLDRPVGEHLLSAGIEFADHRRRDRQEFSGTLAFADDFSGAARQWNLWLQDEWRVDEKRALTFGLRGERLRLEAEGIARVHGVLAPSLALRWEPASGWIARASVGGAMRFPKLEELTTRTDRAVAANTPLEPDLTGNPALRPERIRNLEAGLERHLTANAGTLGANLYLRHTAAFIERRTALEGARWVARPTNVGDARHWGLELSAKLNRADLLPAGSSLRAQLTLPRGAVDDASLNLTRAPRELPRYSLTLGYEGTLPAWQSSWGIHWQRLGPVLTALPEEDAVARRRDLVDLQLTRRLDARLNLRLQLQNLLGTDTRRDGNAAAGPDAWRLTSLEPGQRSWLLSIEGRL